MADDVRALAAELAVITTRPWTLMEVCGGQTHAILRWGLDQLLPPGLRLIHGPGCPVCVTATDSLDAALALARRREVILCSYGDMLRVPGSGGVSLLACRAEGGDVRLLTNPLHAMEIARLHPHREVVFFAVGFETTAPATALLARLAQAQGMANLSLLTAHGRVAAAMEVLLHPEPVSCSPPHVQGFLAAGHVCSVVGTDDLAPLVARHRVPVVVSGFEPLELMRAILECVRLLEAGTPQLVNAYGSVVRQEGNPAARALLGEVFQVVDQPWRGFGVIPAGGLALRSPYANALDAHQRFGLPQPEHYEGVLSPPRTASEASAVPSEFTTTLGFNTGSMDPSPTTLDCGIGSIAAPLSGSPGPPPAAGPLPLPQASQPAALQDLAEVLGPPLVSTSLSATAALGSDQGLPTAGPDQRPRPACDPGFATDPGFTLGPAIAPGPAPASAFEPVPNSDPAPAPDPDQPPGVRGDPCLAGAILRGRILPPACPAFGRGCTPEHPLGAPMVSAEGACAAYHRHRPSVPPPAIQPPAARPPFASLPAIPPPSVLPPPLPSPPLPPPAISSPPVPPPSASPRPGMRPPETRQAPP